MAAQASNLCQNNNKSSKKDCLLDHVEILVSESEKRVNGTLNLRDFFTVYLVETKVTDPNFTKVTTKLGTIWRRYTDFEQLRTYLEATYPYLILPPLPEKKNGAAVPSRSMYSWTKSGGDTLDPDFIERRRTALEVFLRRIASHPFLCFDNLFLGFLQQDEGWRDTCKETGYLQLTESKLKALAPPSLRRLNEQFEAIKDSAWDMETHLSNVLQSRVKIANRLFVIRKLHANYGRVLSEWSACERSMGDGLQKTGHFMDSFAAEIDSLLDEEEVIVDQLKEYLFYATSIQTMCRRRDMLQSQLEKAQQLLDHRLNEKEAIAQGKTGLVSRLLGSIDSEEVRESRVMNIELRIQESKNSVQTAQEELSDFTREALADYDRFVHEKSSGVKKILHQYAVLQAKIAAQGQAAWTHMRQAIEAIPSSSS